MSHTTLPTTRREFLRLSTTGIGLLAFSRFAPSFLVNSARAAVPAPERDRSILVLVQLAGGNDGLNTLIPFEDADYYRLRPTLGIAKDKVLRVSDTIGLNPGMTAMQAMVQAGKLAIVQNVGYPNPNRSHFRSTEIWESATGSNEFKSTGWIGRYLDNACSGVPADSHDPLAVHINTPNGVPQSFCGDHAHPTFGMLAYGGNRRESDETRQLLETMSHADAGAADNSSFLKQTLMDSLVTERKVQQVLNGYKPESVYPTNAFANSLKSVAALIASGMPTRVYFVTLTGFDTHSNQLGTHQNLLATLSDGLSAFQKDLEAKKLDGQVTTMTFSEFGRRPSENESRGTDHGTAAPLFVMGASVKGGLHGTAPLLNLPKNQDLTYSTDFRSIYATMLENWLGSSSENVLGGKFEKVGLFA